jgi:hypothetical protein
MALWNPDGQYDLDPETGQYNQQPQETPQAPRPSSGFDLNAWYQQTLGRAPDANESTTDAANIDKYGPSYFMSDFQKRLAPTGQQQAAPQYQTPAQQWNAQPSATTGRSDELYKLLMDRVTKGVTTDRKDPNIRAQIDPVVAQQERASRNYIDDIAERSGPLANIQGERRLAAERGGQAAGALEAEVIGRDIAAQRDEIAQQLAMAGNMISDDKRLELQNALAQLDAQLRREGYGVQREGLANQRYGMDQSNDQFLRELALREYDTTNKWDYAWSGL